MVPFKESLKLEYKYYVASILQKSSKNGLIIQMYFLCCIYEKQKYQHRNTKKN